MHAVRLAILPIAKSTIIGMPHPYAEMRIQKGKVTLGFGSEILGADDKTALLIFALTKLEHKPKITKDGLAVVADKIWRKLEHEIENLANMFSLASGRPRSLSSPEPCLALQADDEDENDWLAKVTGIKTGGAQFELGLADFDVDIWECAEHLTDREEGMAMLADALRQSNSGKFRECWRIIERAFSSSGQALVQNLSDFLSRNYMDYEKSEVESWVKVRDRMTHADRSRQVMLERDLGHISSRVLQAGYDVLLNKANWRKADSLRRDVWFPGCGLTNRSNFSFVHRGSALQMPFTWIDDFRAFPVNLEVQMLMPPLHWWPKSGPRSEVSSGEAIGLEVKDSLEDLAKFRNLDNEPKLEN